MTQKDVPPRWNFAGLFSGAPESGDYIKEKKRLVKYIHEAVRITAALKISPGPEGLLSYIAAYSRAADLYESLYSCVYMAYSVNTRNTAAARELGVLEESAVPLRRAETEFRLILAAIPGAAGLISRDPRLKEYRFFLREQLELRKRQMSPGLEELAADLSCSGGDAWERLHAALSSTITMPWSKAEKKTLVELRALAFAPVRAVREKAWRLEVEGWKSAALPLSAALNGVKGFSVSLNARRGWRDTLERSVKQSRISGKTFQALIETMTDSLPLFRRYYKAKARLLGLPRLAFFDIFAPLGNRKAKKWTFAQAAAFIREKFSAFAEEYGDFADKAFREGWIDAEIREGKTGGAYCISIPRRGESRILANFDGVFSSVTTLAHELGHAYHFDVLKEAAAVNRNYPMPLAETASIFSETLIMEETLKTASPAEKLPLLENFLQDTGQVIVDILSRFLFEKALFEKRRRGDVPADELCAMMIQAQKDAYGEALDGEFLHPYMWAAKGHYYRHDLGFYNFPYAFGQLFGLGLYARFESEGKAFFREYRKILSATGSNSAEAVARAAGFAIEKKDFWQTGINRIARYIYQFEKTEKETHV